MFGKLVAKCETDSRLDSAAVHLKELIYAVNNMNDNLGGKQDELLDEVIDVTSTASGP